MVENKNVKNEIQNALVCIENAEDAISFNDLYEAYTSILEAIAFLAPHICENSSLKKVLDELHKAWMAAYESMDLEVVVDEIVGHIGNAKGVLRQALAETKDTKVEE